METFNKFILRQAGRRLGVGRRGEKPSYKLRRLVAENNTGRFEGKQLSESTSESISENSQ